MTEVLRPVAIVDVEPSDQSALSVAAILSGGGAAAALTLVLLAFGSAMGFSVVSPWENAGLSVGAFKIATGLYLIVAAMLTSTVGGYLAGRLRSKWTGLQDQETLFRDTAHGFLAWCFATLLGAAVLGTAATYVLGGAASATSSNPTAASALDYYSDELLRAAPGAQGPRLLDDNMRREVVVILRKSAVDHADLSSGDRSYLTQLVSARTGMSQADADRRVADVTNDIKSAADSARKSAAALSLWLALSMLVGAFSASLAAIEGGQLRDGRWKGVIGAGSYRAHKTNQLTN
jgi:hypothetical protein